MKKIVTFLIFCLNTISFGQNINKKLQKAEVTVNQMAYAKSIEAYQDILLKEKLLSIDQLNDVKLKIANLYYEVKDYQNAEKYFASVLNQSPNLDSENIKSYLKYAQVLSSNGKKIQAAAQWKKYNDLEVQDKRIHNFLLQYPNLETLTRNGSSYQIEYVGINTGNADFSPTYFEKGLVFVSGRPKNSAIKRVFSWDNSPFLDLYYLEDLNLLNPTNETASVSSSQSSSNTTTNSNYTSKLGSDYYTPASANDAPTIATNGSEYIIGSNTYYENPSITSVNFSKTLNSKYHEGPCIFYDNFKKIVFTRNNTTGPGSFFGSKKEEINRLHIYFADKKLKDWGNIQAFPHNSSSFSTGHPAMSKDEKTLYFVSDMPGGYGGTDIYMSKYINDQWAEPVNLGGQINTPGNELFPFIDENGNLYFSSDVLPGLGALDIFFINIDQKTMFPYGTIHNLGAPINSEKDDFGIITNGERNTGYFSSNRKRGGTDDDIYKFKRTGTKYGCRDLLITFKNKNTQSTIPLAKLKYFNISNPANVMEGTANQEGNLKFCLPAENEYIFEVNQKNYEPTKLNYSNFEASDFEPTNLEISLEPLNIEVPKLKPTEKSELSKLTISISDKSNQKVYKATIVDSKTQKDLSGVKVKITNRCTGYFQEMLTDKDGRFEFLRNPACDYELIAKKDGYFEAIETVKKNTAKSSVFRKKLPQNTEITNSFFDENIYKTIDVVKLDNIYYGLEEFKIKGSVADDLNKVIDLLNQNANTVIEITSHTDTRGNAQDNQVLSQKRAQEIETYLVKKGIPRNRIKAIGKGETEPVNNCGDGLQCTEAEYQRNRRTEFKLIQIQKK